MSKPQTTEQDIFATQILYREWARRFSILQQFTKAVLYYEKSLECGDDDNLLRTLLGLSLALNRSERFQEAVVVAQKCTAIDPKNLNAAWTLMEAYFDLSEFGKSLACAYQGIRYRQHFRIPILYAIETFEDCVGENMPKDILRRLQPWIRRLAERKKELMGQLNKVEDEFGGIDEEQSRFRVNDPEARLRRHGTRIDRLIAGIYLETTAQDKTFLKQFPTLPGVNSINKSGSTRLVQLARESLSRLNNRQEALRVRQPLYAIRARIEGALTTGLKIETEREIEFKRCLVENEARRILKQLHEARLRRDYSAFFRMIERSKQKFESYSLQLFQERQRYLNALYRMVARVYIDPRNLTNVADNEEKCTSLLRRLLGLKGPTLLPRDSDLAWCPSSNIKRSFDTCRERLALTNEPLEILWLFHELCKLFLEIRRYDLARFYAKKTREISLESNYEDWALNAAHILIRIELAQNNRNEAKEAAVVALESARKLNVHFLEDFYERAIEYIDGLDFGRLSDDDSIAARGKLMSSLMTADMKTSMDLLLRSMDSVPARRKMSVMPGCKPRNRKGGLPRKRMTVKLDPPKDYCKEHRKELLRKYAPEKKIFGLVDFNLYD